LDHGAGTDGEDAETVAEGLKSFYRTENVVTAEKKIELSVKTLLVHHMDYKVFFPIPRLISPTL
jgi:hypothetical protein